MTNSPDNIVQGRAVYMEFINGSNTQQLLVMPEGVTTSHKTVPMTIYRRRLNPVQPRKTWKASAASHRSVDLLTASSVVPRAEVPHTITAFMYPLFVSLQRNGYTLYKQPIVVEVTAEDLELARIGKTPYKTMARVWKSRKALGFPKEYIHAPAVSF